MKILNKNRGDFIRSILALLPYKITSYSQIHIPELSGQPIKAIINTEFKERQAPHTNWVFKTNNKIHAKMVIGNLGVYIGSQNLSKGNGGKHELGIILYRSENPKECQDVEIYFDELWGRG